eukprot:487124_1
MASIGLKLNRFLPRLSQFVPRILPRFVPRIMPRYAISPRTVSSRFKGASPNILNRSRLTIYAGIATATFGTSYLLSTTFNKAQCYTQDSHVFLLNQLRELAPQIDAKRLLKLFLKEFNQEGHNHVTEDFVVELFSKVGIEDEEIASHLFRLMDWDNNGKLDPAELAATFTLFQVGSEIQRYKFLFHCLDLDESRTVDKQEFRSFLTALLEAKYRLSGLQNYKESDELYIDIDRNEYRTIAKIKANTLVREIFLFADQNRDGELNMKEFLHWCNRGGYQVAVLKDLMTHVVDDL